jgi:hypothetical protein
MTESRHEQAYLAALGAASTELSELFVEFQKLEIRKERMERIIDALKPVIELDEQVAGRDQKAPETPVEARCEPMDPHCFLIQHPAEEPVASAHAQGNTLDTIQRRISSALGMAAVA